MLRNRCTLAKEDNRWKDKIQRDVNDNRRPYQDSEPFREIEHEDVGANAQFDQSHAIQIEQLAQPDIMQVLGQVCWRHRRIPHMLSAAILGCLVAAHCACNSENLFKIS